MTSLTSMVLGVLIYSAFQCLKYYTSAEEKTDPGIKSNLGSKLVYLAGVGLFIFRFQKQQWNVSARPLRLVRDALAAILIFEILYSFLWLKIEHFFIETAPSAVRNALKTLDMDTQVPLWPFITPLYVISVIFVAFAHNSDVYLDRWLQPDEVQEETPPARGEPAPDDLLRLHSTDSMTNFERGFGEPSSPWTTGAISKSHPFYQSIAPAQGAPYLGGYREPVSRWVNAVVQSPLDLPPLREGCVSTQRRVGPQRSAAGGRGRGRGVSNVAANTLRRSSRLRNRSTPRV